MADDAGELSFRESVEKAETLFIKKGKAHFTFGPIYTTIAFDLTNDLNGLATFERNTLYTRNEQGAIQRFRRAPSGKIEDSPQSLTFERITLDRSTGRLTMIAIGNPRDGEWTDRDRVTVDQFSCVALHPIRDTVNECIAGNLICR
jgi:hypothetical protein